MLFKKTLYHFNIYFIYNVLKKKTQNFIKAVQVFQERHIFWHIFQNRNLALEIRGKSFQILGLAIKGRDTSQWQVSEEKTKAGCLILKKMQATGSKANLCSPWGVCVCEVGSDPKARCHVHFIHSSLTLFECGSRVAQELLLPQRSSHICPEARVRGLQVLLASAEVLVACGVKWKGRS